MLKKFLAVLAMLYTVAAFAATDVNKATVAELDAIKGIGPGLSTRILDERKKGSFKDWADFVERVRGIGDGNAAKFSAAGLTVNGAAYTASAAPAAPKKDVKASIQETKAKKAEKAAEKAEKAEAKAADDKATAKK